MKELKPKKVHRLCLLIFFTGFLIALCGAFMNLDLALIGLVIMCGSLVFRAFFYRCPCCGRYLGRGAAPYCPYCRADVSE